MKAAVIFAFVYFVLVKSQEATDELQPKVQQSTPTSILLLQSRFQHQQLSENHHQSQRSQQTVQKRQTTTNQFQQDNNKRQDKRAIYIDPAYGGGSTIGYDPYWNYNSNYVSPSTGIGYNPAFTRLNNFAGYAPTSTTRHNPATITTRSWYPFIYENGGLRYRNSYNYDPYTTRVIGLNHNGGYNSYNYNGYNNYDYNNRLNGYRGYNNYPTTGVGYTYGPGISNYNSY